MNVNQLARNQQMMYKFIERGTNVGDSSQLFSPFSSGASGKSKDAADVFLQSIGLSGMQGGTVREMARYQMRVQNAQNTAAAQSASPAQADSGAKAASSTETFSVRQQYTPISDKATAEMQKLALRDAKDSAAGRAADMTERARLIQEQLRDVEPSKRAAAFNTMNRVWESETERIGKHIKEHDPNWTNWGDRFDAKALDDYTPGVNVWI